MPPETDRDGARLVLVVVNHEKYLEWKVLFDYLCENRDKLERQGRMTALVLCLQRHWQDAVKEIPDSF